MNTPLYDKGQAVTVAGSVETDTPPRCCSLNCLYSFCVCVCARGNVHMCGVVAAVDMSDSQGD